MIDVMLHDLMEDLERGVGGYICGLAFPEGRIDIA